MVPSPRTTHRPVFLAWSLFALANLALFLADLRQDFNQMLVPCSGEGCNFLAITNTEVAALESWGLTTSTYALFMSAVPAIVLAVYWFLGGLVLWRQGATRVGLSVSLAVTGRTGQSQPAIVVSTLVVAALFSPLRKRVQERIDRRFYRRRYDAERVLAAFADRARRETDLDALTAQLLEAVQSSLQPERVSIWLRGAGRKR